MSRIEMWKSQQAARVELERSTRVVAYEHDVEDTFGMMDRPMSLGEFMEGHPNGFSTFLDHEDYSEPRFETDELAGYREIPIQRRDSALDELESVFRGGYAELEVGPYEVQLEIVFGTFRNNLEKHGFDEAFRRAAWHFIELQKEYDQKASVVSAAIKRVRSQFGDESLEVKIVSEKLLAILGDPPSPVVLKMDPVVEDLPSQRDAECRWDHLRSSHLEEMEAEEKLLRSTSGKYACFSRMNSEGKVARLAGPEERGHNRELGEARARRFEKIMAWVRKASRTQLMKAFCRQADGTDGKFWALLKASRNKCYPRSSCREGDTLLTRVDVWLSKPQVDSIWGLAKKRLGMKKA